MIRSAIVTLALVLFAACGAPAGPNQTARSSGDPGSSQGSQGTASISIPTPIAVPTAASTATAKATTPASSPQQAELLGAADMGRPLAPGTYRVAAPFARPFNVTFAQAWSLESLSPGDVQFHYVEGGVHNGAPWLIVDVVDNVFADPCDNADGPLKPPVEHSSQAVLSALSKMNNVNAGQIGSIDINGRPAGTLQLTNTVDTDTTRCTGDRLLWMWTDSSGTKSPGTNGLATERLWAFDIDPDVVLVDGETYQDTRSTETGVFEAVAPTIVFD